MAPCQGTLLPYPTYYGSFPHEAPARPWKWRAACLIASSLVILLLSGPAFTQAVRSLPAPFAIKLQRLPRGDHVLLPSAQTFPFGLATVAPPKRARLPEDSEAEWPLRLGKVVDTLRDEYPRILTYPLNPEIYHEEIELRDDHDLRLKGLSLYLSLFHTMRLFFSILGWTPEVTARFTVLLESREVRVRWNVKLNPTNPMPLHLDGVSLYKVGRDGLVYQHTLQFVTMSFNPGVRVPTIPVWAGPQVLIHSHLRRLGLEELRSWVHDAMHSGPATWAAPSGPLTAVPLPRFATPPTAPYSDAQQSPLLRQPVPSPLLTLARAFAKWLPR